MSDNQKEQLFGNMAAAMDGVPERIQFRQLVHLYKADPAYGGGVAGKLGLDMDKVMTWAELPLNELIQVTSDESYAST